MTPADCGRSNDKKCCTSHYWSEAENSCLPCELGYFGDNCTQTCPSGSYGKLCGKKCKCTSDFYCDRAFGCVIKETTIQTSTFISLATSVESSEPIKATSRRTTESTTKVTSKDSSPEPTIAAKEEANNNTLIIIIMGGVIAFLFLIILSTIAKKLFSSRSKKKYPKKENESRHFKEGNELEVYHEINLDEMIANEMPDNRYNRIKDDIIRPKYLHIGSKIEEEIKQTDHEIDKENTTGKDGEYLEPESSGRVHAYIEVIEPLIHKSNSLNDDKDGRSSSNKSDLDELEEYQDTGNLARCNKTCSTKRNDPKTHKSANNEYLDVVNVL